MSMAPHVDPERLGEVDSLPKSHPTRMHLENCSRCQAALAAYRAFLEPPAGLVADERAAARARLRAARESFADGRIDGSGRAAAAGRARWAWPAWKPAWALTAAAAVVAVIYVLFGNRLSEEGPVRLRGTGPDRMAVEGGTTLEIVDVTRDSEGRVRLRWRIAPGADAYRVSLFAANLEVIARFEADGDTTLLVPASALEQKPGAAGQALYWQVAALHEGEEVGTSAMAPVRER